MSELTRRTFAAALVAGGAGATPSKAVSPAASLDLRAVNKELRPAVTAMMKQFGSVPDLTAETLSGTRKMMTGMSQPPSPAPTVTKRSVKGARAGPDVTVHVINAGSEESRPVIVHTHGGGFVLGDAESDIGRLQPMATALDCVIVTVEYRLAPETNYVGSIEDNYAALKWVHDHAAELGADPNRIAVMGESAGGGHAALLAIAARDRGEVPLVFQCLIYPMLDDRTGSATTPAPPIGALAWTAPNNRFGWAAFLGQTPGTKKVPSAAVPARQASFKGLPPAFIGVGSIDLFVDEDVSYARGLIDAGVPAELIVVPGAFHGFDAVAPETAVVRRFNEAKLNALRQAFAAA